MYPSPAVPECPQEPFVRSRDGFEPAYLRTFHSGELARRVERGLELLRVCRVCPRDCDVDRLRDQTGICRSGRHARVGSAFPHFGEEDCLRGWRGSGTIFFAHCNLRCVFCQNFDLSWEGHGQEMGSHEIAGLMLALQRQECHNINFVTPEHVVPQILEALLLAVPMGLRLPLVYNTSAYDSLDSIELLDGVVDIYMPDFKYWTSDGARRFLMAADYPERARQALRAMHRQVGELVFDEQGLALRGVLVRHLVMPGGLSETEEILRFLARELSPDTYVNVMSQYRPAGRVVSQPDRYAEIGRPLAASEHREAVRLAREVGLRRLDGRSTRRRLAGL